FAGALGHRRFGRSGVDGRRSFVFIRRRGVCVRPRFVIVRAARHAVRARSRRFADRERFGVERGRAGRARVRAGEPVRAPKFDEPRTATICRARPARSGRRALDDRRLGDARFARIHVAAFAIAAFDRQPVDASAATDWSSNFRRVAKARSLPRARLAVRVTSSPRSRCV
ncbi:hypothetical protein LV178_06440, partial [Burkholderia mallei]|nr:hypothetical protein [Burkholderia mallei]